jgi:hypothetical protein
MQETSEKKIEGKVLILVTGTDQELKCDDHVMIMSL